MIEQVSPTTLCRDSLDLLNCPPGAIAELIDSVAPDAVVNCTGLAVGDPEDMKSANVYVGDAFDRRTRRMSRRTSGAPRIRGRVRSAAPQPPGVRSRARHSAERLRHHQAQGDRTVDACGRRANGSRSPCSECSTRWVGSPPRPPFRAAPHRRSPQRCKLAASTINLGALDSWRDYIDTRDIAQAVLAAAVTTPRSSSVLNLGPRRGGREPAPGEDPRRDRRIRRQGDRE